MYVGQRHVWCMQLGQIAIWRWVLLENITRDCLQCGKPDICTKTWYRPAASPSLASPHPCPFASRASCSIAAWPPADWTMCRRTTWHGAAGPQWTDGIHPTTHRASMNGWNSSYNTQGLNEWMEFILQHAGSQWTDGIHPTTRRASMNGWNSSYNTQGLNEWMEFILQHAGSQWTDGIHPTTHRASMNGWNSSYNTHGLNERMEFILQHTGPQWTDGIHPTMPCKRASMDRQGLNGWMKFILQHNTQGLNKRMFCKQSLNGILLSCGDEKNGRTVHHSEGSYLQTPIIIVIEQNIVHLPAAIVQSIYCCLASCIRHTTQYSNHHKHLAWAQITEHWSVAPILESLQPIDQYCVDHNLWESSTCYCRAISAWQRTTL